MQAFNLIFDKVNPQSNVKKPFKPWNIYDVKFEGCSVEHIKGKKDPNATYDILKTRFANDEGYYEERIFFPKDDKDAERPVYKNSEGHDYYGASNLERAMTFVAQVASVMNPEGYKKMQELSKKFTSFDDVCKVLIKITDPKKNSETKLKLVGRKDKNGTVHAVLPKFCAVNKEGELFTCDNFIGDKLFFSAYEEQKKAEYQNAKPTSMPSETNDFNPDGTKGSEDLDGLDGIDFSSL